MWMSSGSPRNGRCFQQPVSFARAKNIAAASRKNGRGASNSQLLPTIFGPGWGYQLLTNQLPNSNAPAAGGKTATFRLRIAFDTAGLPFDLEYKTLRSNNAHATKPSVPSIRPGPGEGHGFSGTSYVNFGLGADTQTREI